MNKKATIARIINKGMVTRKTQGTEKDRGTFRDSFSLSDLFIELILTHIDMIFSRGLYSA
jgi:hypothetical protein